MAKLILSTWADYVAKLLRYQNLPNGTEVHLFVPNKDDRKKRMDFHIKAPLVRANNVRVLDDEATVQALFDLIKEQISSPSLAKLDFWLRMPDGQYVERANKKLGTVRRMPAVPTGSDLARLAAIDHQVIGLQRVARQDVKEAERSLVHVSDSVELTARVYLHAAAELVGRARALKLLGEWR